MFSPSRILPIAMVMSILPPVAHAHVFYEEIALASTQRHQMVTSLQSVSSTSANCWTLGTRPQLGIQMGASCFLKYFRFTLDKPALVNITASVASAVPAEFVAAAITMDPAFSLYRGLLPDSGMDTAPFDPLRPIAMGPPPFKAVVSPFDAAPDDPGIRHVNGLGAAASVNPDWTRTFAELAADPNPDSGYKATAVALWAADSNYSDKTPEQWYGDHYQLNNAYRDTLNYTATGGVWLPEEDSARAGTAKQPYEGQFNALGDWSEAVEGTPAPVDIAHQCNGEMTKCFDAGDPSHMVWSKVFYEGHANRHDGVMLEGRASTNTAPERLHGLALAEGDYSIIFGGGCSACTLTPGADSGFSAMAGIAMKVETWPLSDCQKGQVTKPKLAPVSGPWDIAEGGSLTVPIQVNNCGGEPLNLLFRGRTPLLSSVTGGPGQFDAVGQAWKTVVSVTAKADALGASAEPRKQILKVFTKNSEGKSNVQKLLLRVWPQGQSPGTAYTLGAVKAYWDAGANKLKVRASMKLRWPAVLTPEEKAGLMAEAFYALDENDNFKPWFEAVHPNPSGVIKVDEALDSSRVPCAFTWRFKDLSGGATVEAAPSGCK